MMGAMENITSYRTKHGLSREQFGDLIGVTGETVRLVELGQRRLSHKKTLQLEEATGGELTRYDIRPDIYGQARIGGNPKGERSCDFEM